MFTTVFLTSMAWAARAGQVLSHFGSIASSRVTEGTTNLIMQTASRSGPVAQLVRLPLNSSYVPL